MDILNFISWIRARKVVSTVDADTTLIPIGVRDETRDDKYVTKIITVSDLATQIGPGGGVTLTSAGGSQSLVNDGTGPSLATKGISNGNGISLSSTATALTITNSAPDQTVVLNNGTGISTSGTYPNFTITNTSPDQTVALTPGTGIGITGTYPNFTITNSSPSSGGTITALTNDVTASGTGSVVATIANDAVTYAKMQNVSTNNRLLGRASAGAGNVEEITLGTGLSLSGTTLNATGGGSGYTYEIGQYVPDQGGVIFHRYLDGTNQHYLVVSIADQSASSVWSNINNVSIGTGATSTLDGLSNSNAIVAQSGFTNGAASTCLNYSIGSVTDWYLPAIDELSLLWHNRFNVNRTLSGVSSAGPISGAQILQIAHYWSSTEWNNTTAYYFLFVFGYANVNFTKNTTINVRAIRKFSIPI